MAAALGAQACTHQGREAELPGPDRLVRQLVAPLVEELGDVAESKFVAKAPEDGQQNDVGGKLKIVEGRAGAFTEPAAARPAREPAIAQGGAVLAFARGGRSAMRTVDEVPPRLYTETRLPLSTLSSDGTGDGRVRGQRDLLALSGWS